MTDRTLAERLRDEATKLERAGPYFIIETARKAADAFDAKDTEIARLVRALGVARSYVEEGMMEEAEIAEIDSALAASGGEARYG